MKSKPEMPESGKLMTAEEWASLSAESRHNINMLYLKYLPADKVRELDNKWMALFKEKSLFKNLKKQEMLLNELNKIRSDLSLFPEGVERKEDK